VKNELQVAPLASATTEIGGLLTIMHGITVALLLDRREFIKDSGMQRALYRIEKFNVNTKNGQQTIQLCWINRHS
jgi:hypothetical protein